MGLLDRDLEVGAGDLAGLTYGLAVLAVGAYSIPLLLIGWLSNSGFPARRCVVVSWQVYSLASKSPLDFDLFARKRADVAARLQDTVKAHGRVRQVVARGTNNCLYPCVSLCAATSALTSANSRIIASSRANMASASGTGGSLCKSSSGCSRSMPPWSSKEQ